MGTGKKKERGSLLIKGLQEEQMKTYIVPISAIDSRIKYLYEASSDAEEGEECTRTIYVYIGTSGTVLFSQELKDTWQDAFDVDALANAQLAVPPYTLE